MKLSQIKNSLKKEISPFQAYRRYGIFIPIFQFKNTLHLIYEVRADTLKTQPGEVCFPGGAIEKNESAQCGAIRETCEELGISKKDFQILGAIEPLVTPFQVILYPFVGTVDINSLKDLNPNVHEVQRVFSIPLNFFMEKEPETHYVKSHFSFPQNFPFHKIAQGKNYKWQNGTYPIHFYEYENEQIWGMTARITKNFIDAIKTKNSSDAIHFK